MYERKPWTQQQLDEMLPKLEMELDKIEAEYDSEVNPVPPCSVEEALQYIFRLMSITAERPLTDAERFLHGQLLSALKMSIQAETLGHAKGGRYFVASEEDLKRVMAGKI